MILKKKHIIQISLIAIISSFVACSNSTDGNAKIEGAEIIDFSEMPSMVGDSIHTLYTDSGRLTYRMKAPKLAIYDKGEEPYWDFPQGVNMITYTIDGEVDADIKSDLAVYDVKKDLWELKINVEAVNLDGTTLETELLYFDQKKELVYSDKLVKITEDGMITIGTGFESDLTFENYHMDDFTTEFIMED